MSERERIAVSADLISTAVQAVSRQHYTNHPELGSVPQSTAQAAIERDLARAGVEPGMRVMEIGTGTGYTGALLAEMVGASGHVVSIDIDPSLTARAGKLHAERGVSNLTLVSGDGHAGAAEHAPYDIVIGWATPTHIPAAWVEQCAPGGRIATPVYIAPVARTVGHATVTIDEQGVPTDPTLGPAVYVDMGVEINTTLGIPLFFVDASVEGDSPAWVSVGWRDMTPEQDPTDTLALLQHPSFSQKVAFSGLEEEQAARWRDFRAYCVGHEGTSRSNLTAFGTGAPDWITAIGFSSGNNASVLTAEGQLLGNREDSPAVTKLQDVIREWYDGGRPGLEASRAQLSRSAEGWIVSASLSGQVNEA
ncbi:methyltransferase domain-containing protein [Kribbella antibiotica]|uniref:Protein-L-isoaspartate O-methyltransferase n=1 Tax=Kribbella antibiotica TaxID=190195 RepID=A0A4R4YX59_9ACTN|nr:methyltransferase domain-containing protein [Kribbella antibiotica]TDD50068.1 methyltransferase domain-containing protein [Kribbella antibiotica]